MAKILTIIFSCFAISSHCLDDYNKNLINLKKEINEVFKKAPTDPDKPIYLITVTRSSKNNTNGWTVNNPIMKDTTEVEAVLKEVETQINAKCADGHKIIAFNEMLFSQETPLDKGVSGTSVTHDSILNCIKNFNKNVPESIIFYNVLYKEEKNIDWKKALYLYALTLFRYEKGYLNFESIKSMPQYVWDVINKHFAYTTTSGKTSAKIVEDYVNNYITGGTLDTFPYSDFINDLTVKTVISTKVPLKTNFLINRTYCVHNKKTIFQYNKSAYYKENDNLIKNHNYVYDLGDGYPELTETDVTSKKIFTIHASL